MGLLLTAGSCQAFAQGTAANGTLYYTTFTGTQRVHKVDYNYDGAATYVLSSSTDIAATPGGDGIIFAPDGQLLVGGQGTGQVYKVDPNAINSFVTKASGVAGAYHLSLDPSGTKFYAAGLPGNLGVIPLNPFADGTQKVLSGSVSQITSIAFDTLGNAYYTASGGTGNGSVGRINLTTGVTTEVIANLPAAHGMVYDSFTNKLTLFGASHITQLNLDANLTQFSDLDLSTLETGHTFQLDQGATDGHGHALVADNNANLVFLDYSTGTNQVASYGFLDQQFLATSLDDVAPLSGLGSNTTPEPGTLGLLFGMGMTGSAFAFRRLRRRR